VVRSHRTPCLPVVVPRQALSAPRQSLSSSLPLSCLLLQDTGVVCTPNKHLGPRWLRLLSFLSPPPLSMCPLLQIHSIVQGGSHGRCIIMARGRLRKCKQLLALSFGSSARCGWRRTRNTSAQEAEEGWWRWWWDGGSAVMQRNRRGCDQGTCILLIRLLAILARFPLGRPFPRETAPHTAPALQRRPSLRLWCCMRRGVIALSSRMRRGVIALSFRLLAVCVCVCVCVCVWSHACDHSYTRCTSTTSDRTSAGCDGGGKPGVHGN